MTIVEKANNKPLPLVIKRSSGLSVRNILLALAIFSICFFTPLACVHRTGSAHREAVETLLEMFDMEEISKQSVYHMAALHVQQDPQLGLYKDVLIKFYSEHMGWESLKDEFIAIYTEEFSEEEIRDLIAFYKTPTGQKAIKKMPVLMSKCAQIGEQRLRENMPEWHQMLQEETERLRKLQERKEASPQSRR